MADLVNDEQATGLGRSAMAETYAISSLAQARAHLADPSDPLCQQVLDRYFDGAADEATVQRLQPDGGEPRTCDRVRQPDSTMARLPS